MTSASPSPRRRYRFEDLILDTGQRRLWRGDEQIRLSKLTFDFLLALVEAAPNLLTQDQLAKAVWGPQRVITPENVSQRLKMLRHALGEQAERPRYIEAVRGQGYRLLVDVEAVESLPGRGTTALVMELVEGPTLADRISRGPIPPGEALGIALQIAEALEAAHDKGVVHRDLKPANIKLGPDGTVEVLDFGIAEALEPRQETSDPTSSSTTPGMAQAGTALGTAAYMSPEQARGKPVDERADIWAFGCVLYEMLTGAMAFPGRAGTDTLAAVIRGGANWSLLPVDTPPRIRALLHRCLDKDLGRRPQTIGEARIIVESVLSGAPGDSGFAGVAKRRSRLLPWSVAGLVLCASVPVSSLLYLRRASPAVPPLVRSQFPFDEATEAPAGGVGSFALSPDGRRLAFFAAGADNVWRVWVRSLDSLKARPLPGTEVSKCCALFWSPDSRSIAFAVDRKLLKRTAVAGGIVQTVCASCDAVRGSWNRDGVIIFGQPTGGLMRVSAGGGTPSPLTVLDASRHELSHDVPFFLPDGRHFVYVRFSTSAEDTGAYIGSLDVKPEDQNTKPFKLGIFPFAYFPSGGRGAGHLLFIRGRVLWAQPFDPDRLEFSGEPVKITERALAAVSASANAVIYQIAAPEASRLTWIDRQGKLLSTPVKEAGAVDALALSPDGRRAALWLGNAEWLYDSSRGTNTRFTFDSLSGGAIWSPDGRDLIFTSTRDGGFYLYRQPADSSKEATLLSKFPDAYAASWSRDGRFLLYSTDSDPATPYDLWVLPLQSGGKPFAFLHTKFSERNGEFSPDGRWVAYESDESGRFEIYVRPFSPNERAADADAGGKTLISTDGGIQPHWRGDGKELYYLAPDRTLMAVEVGSDGAFHAGIPKALFRAPPNDAPGDWVTNWAVTSDGNRFLFASPAEENSLGRFTVAVNWQALLK